MPSVPRSTVRRFRRVVLMAATLAAAVLGGPVFAQSGEAETTAAPNTHVAEAHDIRIRTEIVARNYAWEVTNVRGPAIRRIELPVRHIAGVAAPEGWTYEVVGNSEGLIVTTDGLGLRAGRSMTITCQAPFDLARLTTVTALVDRGAIGGEAETFEVADVWVPGPKKRSALLLTTAMLAGIAVIHLVLVERRVRRQRAAAAADSGPRD